MTINEMLEKALPENAEAAKAVKDYLKNNKNIKFVDLADGEYVGVGKYNDLESKYNNLKNAENPFEQKYNDLVVSSNNAITEERTKLVGVAKQLAVNNAINSLGGLNDLAKQGIKALINFDAIEIDDDYNIKGDSLDKQISGIKEQYKDAFVAAQPVGTGAGVAGSVKHGGDSKKQYSTLDEIRGLSLEQVMSDYDNITAQLASLTNS